MKLVVAVFAFCCFQSASRALSTEKPAAVAIIGAGIGGSTTAYHLRRISGNDTDIQIFERYRIGGRTQVYRAEGRVIEMGASIVHEQNKHFRELAITMGLKRIEPGVGSKEGLLSIYDGQQFVFNQSSWTVLTLARMILRYGLSLFWFQKAPQNLLKKFGRIYALQSEGHAFSTPEALMKEIGLYKLTQHDMNSEVQELLGSGAAAKRFADEFVAGINHINYNQNNSLNAFAGMVSLLPTIDDRLFALEGGNFQLALKLLQAAKARLQQPAKIDVIERTSSGSYMLHTSEGRSEGLFTAVVIAAPLELANLSFEGVSLPNIPARKFQTTVTTIHKGRLRPSYFGVQKLPAGEHIMVAEGAGTPFSVIAPLTEYKNGTRLYKTFSASALSEKDSLALFEEHSIVAQHAWEAYPRFNPPEKFAPFELAEGLYYSNAWENAASAMEIAAIEGINSALLVEQFLSRSRPQPHRRGHKEVEL